MIHHVFDPAEVPADLRDLFEEVEVQCGAPWARVVERQTADRNEAGVRSDRTGYTKDDRGIARHRAAARAGDSTSTTLGFRPTCACAAPAIPPLILDPFLGAGTVAGVAEALGRRWTGCELSAEYAALVPQRIAEVAAWFARRQEKRAIRRRAVVPAQQVLPL